MSARLSFRMGLGLHVLVGMVAIAAAGVRVKLESVPQPAVKAVQDRFAKAVIRYVDRETNGDFEFAMKEGDRLFDVGVSAMGKLINIKEEIDEEKLPKLVKQGLLKKYPTAKVVETEKVIVIADRKERVTYEIKAKAEKKTFEIVLDEGGKEINE
ncbi:MAG: hypothetical protein AB7K24_21325 [Gemmataceae bacterium]